MDTFTKMLVAVAAGLSASALVGCGGDAPCLMTGDKCTVFADNAACIQCTADAATSGGADPKAVAAAILACSPDVACVPKEVETKTPAAASLDCDKVGDKCVADTTKCDACKAVTDNAKLLAASLVAKQALVDFKADTTTTAAAQTAAQKVVADAADAATKAYTDVCGGIVVCTPK